MFMMMLMMIIVSYASYLQASHMHNATWFTCYQ